MIDYKYFYSVTSEFKKTCHPDLCGYIATNNRLDNTGKLKSGYLFSFYTNKTYYNDINNVKQKNYIEISKDTFLTEIKNIGFLLNPIIGDIVSDTTYDCISRVGQIINIFPEDKCEEIQIENYKGDIKRLNIENLRLASGTDLSMYKAKGKMVFKLDFTSEDESTIKTTVLSEENCISEIHDVKEVTNKRKINALYKEISQLSNSK